MNIRSLKGDCVFSGHYTLSEDKVCIFAGLSV